MNSHARACELTHTVQVSLLTQRSQAAASFNHSVRSDCYHRASTLLLTCGRMVLTGVESAGCVFRWATRIRHGSLTAYVCMTVVSWRLCASFKVPDRALALPCLYRWHTCCACIALQDAALQCDVLQLCYCMLACTCHAQCMQLVVTHNCYRLAATSMTAHRMGRP